MTDETIDAGAVTTRPFADVLLDLDSGRVHAELSNALQSLVNAVAETGKKGTIGFSLTIAPSKSEAPFEAIPAVVLKAPQPNRRASLFYADDSGNLVRRDPHQQELPGLRDITSDPTTRPIREAR